MFERATRLKQAEKALAQGRFEEALKLASEPEIAVHRRAEQVRVKARQALLERAERRLQGGNLAGARRDLVRAGGDATLQARIQDEASHHARHAKDRTDRLARAETFLRVGYPRRVDGLPLAGERAEEGWRDLLGRAQEACRTADETMGEVVAALGKGEVGGARRSLSRLRSLDREHPGLPGLTGKVLRAWGGPRLDECTRILKETGPLAAWERIEELLAEEPGLLELAGFGGLVQRVGEAACREALRWIEAEEPDKGARIVRRLTTGRAAFLAPPEAGRILLLREARSWSEQGCLFEALGLLGAWPWEDRLARRWAKGWRDRLERIKALPGDALRASLAGRLQAGIDLLGEKGATGPAILQELRQALEQEALREREALEEAQRLLGEGRPGRALASLARLHRNEKIGEVQALVGDVVGQLSAAGEKLGAWRAALPVVVDRAGVQQARAHLERARALDREAHCLDDAFADQEGLEGAQAALEEARAAGARNDPLGVARLFTAHHSHIPAGALALLKEWRNLLDQATDLAILAGLSGREAALVIQARELAGLTPDEVLGLLARQNPVRRDRAGHSPPLPASPARGGDARQGFILRVASTGDLLVIPQESLIVGSANSEDADLKVLARLGRKHACFRRTLSFHKGVEHRVAALEEQEVAVNGVTLPEALLQPGDEVRLGAKLVFRFRRPCPASASPLLLLDGDFEVEGCRRVAWCKSPGWDGLVALGAGEDVHLQVPRARARLEFSLDRHGRLLVRSSDVVEVDGVPAGKESPLLLGQEVASGGVQVYVDGRPAG